MPTAQDIITDALLEANVLDQPGQTPSAELLAYGLGKINRHNAIWSTRQLYIWTELFTRFTLVASQQSYTIGPASTSANWTADRPVGQGPGNGIKYANLVITGSPDVLLPMAILNAEDWASMRVRDIDTTTPTAIYNDGATPKSTLYLYGVPTLAYQLELWRNKQIGQFSMLSDAFDWPAGYQEAVTLTLAEGLCGPLGRKMPNGLPEMARRARAAVTSLNSAPGKLDNDAALSGGRSGGYFNYKTGQVI